MLQYKYTIYTTLKTIKCFSLLIWVTLSFSSYGTLSDNQLIPAAFKKAVTHPNGGKVLLIDINDPFADGEGITAALSALRMSYQIKQENPKLILKNVFISSDEFNMETLKSYLQNKVGGFLEEYYHAQLEIPPPYAFSSHPFRIQDAATVLFPYADHLGMDITLIPGDIRTEVKKKYLFTSASITTENNNPYFGNFGNGFTAKEEQYIARIKKEVTFTYVIEEGINEGFEIYITNGGSLTLLSKLAQERPELAKHLNVVLMGFRQPIPWNEDFSYSLSHNESLDIQATEEFLKRSHLFKRVEAIDSNMSCHAPQCGKDIPAYKDYLITLGLQQIVSKAAFVNLLNTEKRHYQRYGAPLNRPTCLIDIMLVAYLKNEIHIPMHKGLWRRYNEVYAELDEKTSSDNKSFKYALIPVQEDGYQLALPYLHTQGYSGHPYLLNPVHEANSPTVIALIKQLKQEIIRFATLSTP